jgi:GT2 family glycosyltransferase
MDDAVDRLLITLRSADRVEMAGPLLLNTDGSEQAGGRRKLPKPSLVLAWATGAARLGRLLRLQFSDFLLHRDPLPDHPVEVEAISGACMMVRREAITDIGSCARVDEAGRSCSSEAKVVHHKGVSSQTQRLTVEYYKHVGGIRFYRKLFGQTRPRWFLALLAAGVWTRFGPLRADGLV